MKKNKIFSTPLIMAGIAFLVAASLFAFPASKTLIATTLGLFQPENTNAASAETNNEHKVTSASMPDKPEFAMAPSVVFKDGNGKTIDISKQKGKVLFINFWATWCPPCIAEMPSIDKLKAELPSEDILFLMVDVDDNYKKSKKFMDNRKFNLPVYTQAGAIPENLLSGSIPTTVIIDKEGRVVGRHEGAGDYTRPEVVKYFKELTAK